MSDTHQNESEDQWMSISDLMAGLMILFLFIAITFMKDILIEKNKIEEVAVTFQETKHTVLNSPHETKRFHLSDCHTLEKMRISNRYDRYWLTYNTTGKFFVERII